jgi:hypothetical protein
LLFSDSQLFDFIDSKFSKNDFFYSLNDRDNWLGKAARLFPVQVDPVVMRFTLIFADVKRLLLTER